MSVQVYGVNLSAPCRNVYLTLEALKVPYKVIETVPFKGDTKTPEYLKMNPHHNVPLYKEGDFHLNESRAITTYLVAKHGSTKLYPTDIKTRAVIDQRLYFEMGSFYKSFFNIATEIFGGRKPSESHLDSARENLKWLNDYVKPTGYVAGTKHITLADIAFMPSYTTLAALNLIDMSPYKELPAWLARIKQEVPNHDKANGEGVAAFMALIKPKMQELGL